MQAGDLTRNALLNIVKILKQVDPILDIIDNYPKEDTSLSPRVQQDFADNKEHNNIVDTLLSRVINKLFFKYNNIPPRVVIDKIPIITLTTTKVNLILFYEDKVTISVI